MVAESCVCSRIGGASLLGGPRGRLSSICIRIGDFSHVMCETSESPSAGADHGMDFRKHTNHIRRRRQCTQRMKQISTVGRDRVVPALPICENQSYWTNDLAGNQCIIAHFITRICRVHRLASQLGPSQALRFCCVLSVCPTRHAIGT